MSLSSRNGSVKSAVPSISSEIQAKEDELSPKAESEQETSWSSIYLLTAISMFCGIQFSVFFPTLWPFLEQVDPTASEEFFGFITAAFSLGQALASPVFGYWMNKQKSIKQPLVFGTIVMIISNVIFCFVEAFNPDTSRRWIMMVARFFVGVGAGTVGVMRAYASTASSLNDRAKAITFVQASYILGMTVGPGIQVAFTPINYPGIHSGAFHLDMYTAPAWFASIINIISLLFIFLFLKENYAGVTEVNTDDDPYFAMPKYDMPSVVVCILTQFTLMFIITNLETVGSMYSQIMWKWTKQQTVKNTGILQAVNGGVSCLVYAAIAIKLGPYISANRERIWTIFGLALGCLFHVATFPYPFITKHINTDLETIYHKDGSNETIGCDVKQYDWCTSTRDVNFWVYAIFYGVVLGACFPIVNIAMNTLFSKILGSRRQGTMQGIMLMSGSTARTIGPILVSWLFKIKGPIPLWYIEVGILLLTMVLWIIFYRRMTPLDSNPALEPYESYKYDRGVKYRI